MRNELVWGTVEALALVLVISGWAVKGFQDPVSMVTIAICAASIGFYAGMKLAIDF